MAPGAGSEPAAQALPHKETATWSPLGATTELLPVRKARGQKPTGALDRRLGFNRLEAGQGAGVGKSFQDPGLVVLCEGPSHLLPPAPPAPRPFLSCLSESHPKHQLGQVHGTQNFWVWCRLSSDRTSSSQGCKDYGVLCPDTGCARASGPPRPTEASFLDFESC